MRKLIPLFLVVLLGLAGATQAQETYSVGPVASPDVTALADYIVFKNAQVCLEKGAVGGATCTQAQACTAAGVAGGAACTNADARAAGVRIWPNSLAGRQEFVIWMIADPKFKEMLTGMDSLREHVRKLRVVALTTLEKNNVCTSLSLPPGCFP